MAFFDRNGIESGNTCMFFRGSLNKSLNLPFQQDDEFLLIREGQYQQAATQAQT